LCYGSAFMQPYLVYREIRDCKFLYCRVSELFILISHYIRKSHQSRLCSHSYDYYVEINWFKIFCIFWPWIIIFGLRNRCCGTQEQRKVISQENPIYENYLRLYWSWSRWAIIWTNFFISFQFISRFSGLSISVPLSISIGFRFMIFLAFSDTVGACWSSSWPPKPLEPVSQPLETSRSLQLETFSVLS